MKQRLGKQSLDVAADRIARTAWSALALLQTLRVRLCMPIPLAWDPEVKEVSAIEVYPAATLAAAGISVKRYKDRTPAGASARERVITAVAQQIEVASPIPKIDVSSDGVDAIVCVLAAHHFVTNQALLPPDDAPVKREGWIWVRDRQAL